MYFWYGCHFGSLGAMHSKSGAIVNNGFVKNIYIFKNAWIAQRVIKHELSRVLSLLSGV